MSLHVAFAVDLLVRVVQHSTGAIATEIGLLTELRILHLRANSFDVSDELLFRGCILQPMYSLKFCVHHM